MSAAIATWVDGVRAETVPADDRGLHYGDGLFETICIRGGVARFLEAHLARLAAGCARLAIRFDAMPALRAEIAAVLAEAPERAVLKIIVTRGSAVKRGYAPQGNESARRLLTLWPDAGMPTFNDGVTLAVATSRLSDNPTLAGIKHLSRLENVIAAAEAATAGAFDALMRDGSGSVISGAMSNLFVVRGGHVSTPPVDRCGVAGILRGVVLREGAALGIPVSVEPITLEGLNAVDEAFVTNARIGVVPVRRVGEHAFHMTTVARRLRTHLETLDA